ncbi:MAG: hypothetical protein ATN31_11260 [Candidatus Epulonipiscioides saccharophilum]|nr:MAG: hypothetical protein ATN31_11260 [Epulopiscium sp. AS2M-Bin001]
MYYDRILLQKARSLRKNMTKQERFLWSRFLKRHPIKFLQQRPIDPYIVDFYCHQAKLVIEVDGSQHYTEEGMKSDKIRSDFLGQYGLEVIRFSNDEVWNHIKGVKYTINKKLKEKISTFDFDETEFLS